jgi:hypothetical protein
MTAREDLIKIVSGVDSPGKPADIVSDALLAAHEKEIRAVVADELRAQAAAQFVGVSPYMTIGLKLFNEAADKVVA